MEIPIFILAGLINWQHEMYLSENFTFPRTAPCPLVPIICSEMSHMHSWAKFLLFAFSKLILTTGTQLLKQFVEDRKMQTIHLKGKFPTFTVICPSGRSSWAAKWPKKERRKQMWRENYFSYQRYLFTRSSWATQRPDRDWSSRTLPTSPRTPTLPPEGWEKKD